MQRTMRYTLLAAAAAMGSGACHAPSKPAQGQSSSSSGEFQYGALGAHRTLKDVQAQRRAERAARETRDDEAREEADQASQDTAPTETPAAPTR